MLPEACRPAWCLGASWLHVQPCWCASAGQSGAILHHSCTSSWRPSHIQTSLFLPPLQASLVQSRIKALERLGESEVVEEDPEFVFKFPPPDTVAPPIMGFNDVSAAGAYARHLSWAAKQLHGLCQTLCPCEGGGCCHTSLWGLTTL